MLSGGRGSTLVYCGDCDDGEQQQQQQQQHLLLFDPQAQQPLPQQHQQHQQQHQHQQGQQPYQPPPPPARPPLPPPDKRWLVATSATLKGSGTAQWQAGTSLSRYQLALPDTGAASKLEVRREVGRQARRRKGAWRVLEMA